MKLSRYKNRCRLLHRNTLENQPEYRSETPRDHNANNEMAARIYKLCIRVHPALLHFHSQDQGHLLHHHAI